MKVIKTIAISLITTLSLNASLTTEIEKSLVQAVIPNTKISKVKHTPIDGLYEAYLENGNLIYVYPYKRLIVFGEIWTNTGRSLTNESRMKWQEEANKKMLEKLNANDLIKHSFEMKMGSGSNRYEFVVFTDPECPYCKRVEEYLHKTKPNMTFHINYMPLPFHKKAKDWSLQILSSKDKVKAMKTITKTNKDLNITITKEAKEQLKAMEDVARSLNIKGTPTLFVIDKKTNKVVAKIDGANVPEIEKWIKKDKDEK